jgi:hypothetical protein
MRVRQLILLLFVVVSGYGQQSFSSRLVHDNLTSVNNAASPYTVLATDSVIVCDATSGAVVINLPAATGTGREITVKKTDSTSNACTPTRAGSDLIDGATTYSLTVQYAASKVIDQASAVWGRAHVNQLAGDITGVSTVNAIAASAVVTASIAANAVTSAKQAVVNTRRACVFDNDMQSATALAVANFSGRCVIPAASTIVEVDVIGGTGVLTGSAAAPTVTGTGSIQLGKYTPNGGSSTTGLLSAALATASGKACALTSTSGTCINGNTSSSSITISTTALAAGDVLYVSAATPDAAQTWYSIAVIYTVN